MCARRTSDSRRHPRQAPRAATAGPTTATSPEPAVRAEPLAVADTTASAEPVSGPGVDMGAIDVIDQRARRRAVESRTDAVDGVASTPPSRSGLRRVAPTIVHTGGRASGPVSGVVERPLSSRGPGLSTAESGAAAPSIIVSPRLAAEAQHAGRPRVAPAQTTSPPAPTASRQPVDALTGPSNRPVRPSRAPVRPGVLLLAAAAVFAVGFALTRGPSSRGPVSPMAGPGVDPVEREAAPSGPSRSGGETTKADLTSVGPRAPAQPIDSPRPAPQAPGAAAMNPPAQATAPAAAPQPPAAATLAPPESGPAANRKSAIAPDRVEAETTIAKAAKVPAPAVAEAKVVSPGATAQAPTAPAPEPATKPAVDASLDPLPSARPTSTQDQALPRVAQPKTEKALARATAGELPAPARPLDTNDPGSRYDNVPPKAANDAAERVAAERRYDHVPPRAAMAQAATAEAPPTPQKREPTEPTPSLAEQRAHERRYDHVPPRAAQLAAGADTTRATAPRAEAATPLSGSPRIFLQSDPPGATVTVLGQARGKTPISLELDDRVEVVLTHPERRPASVVLEPGRGARWLSVPLDPL